MAEKHKGINIHLNKPHHCCTGYILHRDMRYRGYASSGILCTGDMLHREFFALIHITPGLFCAKNIPQRAFGEKMTSY